MYKLFSLLACATMGVSPVATSFKNINEINENTTIDITAIDGQQEDFIPGYLVNTYESFFRVIHVIVSQQFEKVGMSVNEDWYKVDYMKSTVDNRDITDVDILGLESGAKTEVWNVAVSPTETGIENNVTGNAIIQVKVIFKPGDVSTFDGFFYGTTSHFKTLDSIQNQIKYEIINPILYTHGDALFFAQLEGLDFSQLYTYGPNQNHVLTTQEDIENARGTGSPIFLNISARANSYGISKGLTGEAEFNVFLWVI